jgi:hypothetical protein
MTILIQQFVLPMKHMGKEFVWAGLQKPLKYEEPLMAHNAENHRMNAGENL